MKNAYEVRGDITVIILVNQKYGRHEALISTTKLERVNEFPNTWYPHWNDKTKSFYVYGNMTVEGKVKGFKLHRWITNAPKGMQVDHFNNDTIDNTDSNLRIITHAENQQNRKGAYVTSKSGIRGVTWHKMRKKWQARVQINGRVIHLGLFENIKEAERVAIEARKKYMPYSKEAS